MTLTPLFQLLYRSGCSFVLIPHLGRLRRLQPFQPISCNILLNKNFFTEKDAAEFYQHLDIKNDDGHAYYLGMELARAEIAYQLGKRYDQDELLSQEILQTCAPLILGM